MILGEILKVMAPALILAVKTVRMEVGGWITVCWDSVKQLLNTWVGPGNMAAKQALIPEPRTRPLGVQISAPHFLAV